MATMNATEKIGVYTIAELDATIAELDAARERYELALKDERSRTEEKADDQTTRPTAPPTEIGVYTIAELDATIAELDAARERYELALKDERR